jgi:hypothetical protein
LLLLFSSDGQHPSWVALFGPHTMIEVWAVATVAARKRDSDHLMVVAVFTERPTRTSLAFGAARVVWLPINLKRCSSTSGLLTRLPAIGQSRWSTQIDTILLLSFHQHCCVKKAGIDTMDFRQQVPLFA